MGHSEAGKTTISKMLTDQDLPGLHISADWWHKSPGVVEQIAREVPCYILRFDKSGAVVGLLCRAVGQGYHA